MFTGGKRISHVIALAHDGRAIAEVGDGEDTVGANMHDSGVPAPLTVAAKHGDFVRPARFLFAPDRFHPMDIVERYEGSGVRAGSDRLQICVRHGAAEEHGLATAHEFHCNPNLIAVMRHGCSQFESLSFGSRNSSAEPVARRRATFVRRSFPGPSPHAYRSRRGWSDPSKCGCRPRGRHARRYGPN